MFRSFLSVIVLVCISPLSKGQVLSTTVPLSDWGVTDIHSVELAQFSVVHEKGSDRLEVRALYDAETIRSAPFPAGNRLDIADFSEGFVNLLGGSYATYGGNGGSAEARHFITDDRTPGLEIIYDRKDGGHCGLWMHVFNTAAPVSVRRYLDATPYAYLAVAVRGKIGNEKVVLKIADEEWNRKEDAYLLGDINRYMPGARIDTKWHTALIPLKDILSHIDGKKLATLVFEAFSPMAGSFELGPISFLRDSSSFSTIHIRKPLLQQRSMQKALWMWETKTLFEKNELDRFLAFLKNENIDNVFLALPYDSLVSNRIDGIALDPKTLGPIVRSLNAAGIRAHALAGDKDFILPDRREFVRKTVQNIVEYNKSVSPGEQFYAIHFDIEPYLFPGFASPRQPWFIQNFLQTLDECSRAAHGGGMLIGVDIPFWFDGINELTHLPIVATLGGVTKPLYQHVLDVTDNVALMDYRTSVEGENGIVHLATKELEYADRTGKQIFVGLETAPLPDETILTFMQSPKTGFPETESEKKYLLIAQKENQLIATLATSRDEILTFLIANQVKEQDLFSWTVERATRVPGSASSFAALGGRKLRDAMEGATPLLRKYPSFLGFAIHYYTSFREMAR